jgi:hypothetical protein
MEASSWLHPKPVVGNMNFFDRLLSAQLLEACNGFQHLR